MMSFSLFNKRSYLFILSILSLFALLSACQIQPTQTANTSGFGGTGSPMIALQDSMSGFGGTGKTSSGFGGTGIVGTIQAFGSIWVNGIEIGYGEKTQIESNLMRHDTLKLGQQVHLETLPLEDKTLTGQIHVFYPIAGEITQIDEQNLTINHQFIVTRDDATYYDDNLTLQVGEFVAINGYQNAEQTWMATRINANPDHKTFYQPEPTLNFSSSVKQMVIEQRLINFKPWESLQRLQAVPLKQNHFDSKILSNEPLENKAHPEQPMQIMQPLNPPKTETMAKPEMPLQLLQQQKSLMDVPREQRDLMQLQRDLQTQQQGLREQQQGLQNLKPLMQLNNLRPQSHP
ncbi:DUF5666 domain-containing protein [Thiosulfativibrio zosterae]|uniref:DUF5666 domain-containing protein n=1 Tax=Thiosulfativibrio zosterae TaxID=2675053 RepID=A0A6F8PP05_9GAMM|nr:DUF5666 domain-containing protein [Thiosulfativibrio zosterae]BBP43851.1 hypothetical protein THMIRHAT_15970 [Thiosulfativibrio zosterae]